MADQLVSMLTATQFCLEVELLNYILFQENCRQFFFFFLVGCNIQVLFLS